MKIYTSYFAMMRRLPKNVIPIAICSSVPQWYEGLRYTKLAPKWQIVDEYKRTNDEKKYIKDFEELILSKLDPNYVLQELKELSAGRDICLICYERPQDFCHRHIVSKWFIKHGIMCQELNLKVA